MIWLGRIPGPVDGFNQDQHVSETDKSSITFRGFFTVHRDTLERFQLTHGLFNPRTSFVKQLRKEFRSIFGVRAIRGDRNNAALAAGGSIFRRIVTLVSHRRSRLDVGADIERRFKLSAVADFTTRQMECEW